MTLPQTNMLDINLEDLNPEETFTFFPARKVAFAELSENSPITHSAIAILCKNDLERADAESKVMFTGQELKDALQMAEKYACKQHFTLFGSNCYTFTSLFYCEAIKTVAKRTNESEEEKKNNLTQLTQSLQSLAASNLGLGVTNNSLVRETIMREIYPILEHHGIVESKQPSAKRDGPSM